MIDKEIQIGHSSGRNSGVLHAGIYYSLSRLRCACREQRHEQCGGEDLPVLSCGKVIAPQAVELDGQLELLLERGRANGAEVKSSMIVWFYERVPDGFTATGQPYGAQIPVW